MPRHARVDKRWLLILAEVSVALGACERFEPVELAQVLTEPGSRPASTEIDVLVEVGCWGEETPDLSPQVTYGSNEVEIDITALQSVDRLCNMAVAWVPYTIQTTEPVGERVISGQAADGPMP